MKWWKRKRHCIYWLIGFGILYLPFGCREQAPPNYRPSHKGAKYLDPNRIQFKDGDTFLLDGKPIRFLGIDTPEIIDSTVGIYENQPYGLEAAESTRSWILGANIAEYLPDGKDIYNRRLAHIFVDSTLLAVKLIQNGLAYETVTWYGDNGFPDLAEQILEAALSSPKPKFQKPFLWRKKHQKKRGRVGR
jgi:endonuclease YncB( thermonuclease family)